MAENMGTGIPFAVQFACIGSATVYNDLAGPFFNEMLTVLDKAGPASTDAAYIRDNFDPPSFTFYPPGSGRPLNADFGETLIGIALFIGSPINAWIISKLCDEVYKRARESTGCVGNLMRRLKPSDRVVSVVLDHWFESSGVLVRIECKQRAGEPRDVVDTLIPVALQRADSWVADHGVTHRVIKYRIERGRLANKPMLSEPVSPTDR